MTLPSISPSSAMSILGNEVADRTTPGVLISRREGRIAAPLGQRNEASPGGSCFVLPVLHRGSRVRRIEKATSNRLTETSGVPRPLLGPLHPLLGPLRSAARPPSIVGCTHPRTADKSRRKCDSVRDGRRVADTPPHTHGTPECTPPPVRGERPGWSLSVE